MTAFWRTIVDEPDAFPPECWQLFLQSSLTALGEKCRPICVGMTWRRLIAAGAMRKWRPRLEEVNREVRQFGVAVPGGVEHVGLRARTLHETGNWLVLTDCSNAFNIVKRTAVLEEVAKVRASAHAVSGQVLLHKTSRRVYPDGLRGDQDDRLLQRCLARGPHGTGNVLPGIATGAEAIPTGIRGRRSGNLRVHGRYLSRPYGKHG
ncbi:unnamed protein product [Laminaria digitata]